MGSSAVQENFMQSNIGDIPCFDTLCLNKLHSPVWIYDVTKYGVYWANQAAIELWEADCLDELISRDFKPGTSEAIQHTLQSYLLEFSKGKVIDRWWRISPNGVDKHILCRFSGIMVEGQRMAMLVEAHSSELINYFAQGGATASIIGLFNRDGSLRSCNPLFKEQFGELVHRIDDLFDDDLGWSQLLIDSELESFEQDVRLNTVQGSRWHRIEVKYQPAEVMGQDDVIATMIDIHERKLKEIKMRDESLSDPLTKLLNRRGLAKQLKRLQGAPFHLFYLDLDGFKPVNDNYGHACGDDLLKHIADILRNEIHANVTVARIGGDEFVVLIADTELATGSGEIATQIIDKLSMPVTLPCASKVQIGASVGIARYPQDADCLESILVKADAAMYMAKQQGKGRWIQYRSEIEQQHNRQLTLKRDFADALISEQLNTCYQQILGPKQDACFVEVLVCWSHPELGVVETEEVIKVAEDTGNAIKLELWVLKQLGLEFQRLQQSYGQHIRASVNLSSGFLSLGNSIELLKSGLSEASLSPQQLLIEIDEETYVQLEQTGDDALNRQGVLNRLFDEGFELIIDNFSGRGSSLVCLPQSKASLLKLNTEFCANIESDHSVVKAIVQLCEQLDINCCINGVSRKQQQQIAIDCGVQYFQGFLYGGKEPCKAS